MKMRYEVARIVYKFLDGSQWNDFINVEYGLPLYIIKNREYTPEYYKLEGEEAGTTPNENTVYIYRQIYIIDVS